MGRFKEYFKRKTTIPPGSQFITEIKVTKHRQVNGNDPVLVFTIEVDGQKVKYAIHQGLAWQLIRQIHKQIGFSESELDAAQWFGRYSGGDGF